MEGNNAIETNKMNDLEFQELCKSLAKIPHTSGHLRKTLTSAFVAEYFSIITCPEIVEIDALNLSGRVNIDVLDQYMVLGGYKEMLRGKMFQLVKKMDDYFSSKLLDLINKELKGQKGEGVANLFESIEKLAAYRPVEFNGKLNFRASLIHIFQSNLFALLGCELIEIYDNSSNINIRNFIKQFIDLASSEAKRIDGIQFSGLNLYLEIQGYKKILSDDKNLNELDESIGYRLLTEEERLEIQEENEAILQEIKKEVSYKKILLHKFRAANPQMMFLADDFTEYGKSDGSCVFRINFDKGKDIGLPDVISDRAGNLRGYFGNTGNVLNLCLNPVNGDLCLLGSYVQSFSLFFPEDRHLLLKNYLFKELRNYLITKESDIPDLFALSAVENINEVNAQVNDNVDAAIEPTWTYVPYEKPPQNDVENSEDDQIEALKTLPKHIKKLIIDKIWGASGSEALAALKRLLKTEVRQQGSHVFFYSERTNQTLPVPAHADIAPPLIMANLKNWGYSLMEYAQELGLKI